MESQAVFEYTFVSGHSAEDVVEKANRLGREGWEMVSTYVLEAGSFNRTVATAYFKRRMG